MGSNPSMGNWEEFYQQGGPTMHVILMIAIVGAAVVAERAWQLLIRCNVDAGRLLSGVQALMFVGDTAGALRLCSIRPSAAARVIRAGVVAGIDRWRAEAAVREAQMQVMPVLTRRIASLSSLASLAMLVGLLGTIFGLVQGFRCGGGAHLSAEHRSAALAQSISIAINTTGFGILVAAALLSARLWLATVRDRLVADVALVGAKVMNLVTGLNEPTPELTSPYR
ncbi:MAG: MotA/TolQ/ExbB proton channel family protein [Nannocystaceae bacterium]|nr:MotA/TolQ/ExbB proton channel family protein [Nannocystaceae bacterium]